MIVDDYEHPGITRCQKTGHAYPQETEMCKCGHVATHYGDTSGFMCVDCALTEWDGLSEEEQLEMLGFEPI